MNAELVALLEDAARYTRAVLDGCGGPDPPRLAILNTPRWEVGHVGWFHERFALRDAFGAAPVRSDSDELWDSSAVEHGTRWALPLPAFDECARYADEVRAALAERVAGATLTSEQAFAVLMAVAHEDMHGEAFCWTRQTLGLPPAPLDAAPPTDADAGPLEGAVEFGRGTFELGAAPRGAAALATPGGFVHDNERWAHRIALGPFRLARAKVTQGEFAAFVDDGGYARRELWSDAGWRWREEEGATLPLHWRRGAAGCERRAFDRWVALEPHRPVLHVNAHEAEAWCRWRGVRLPTEAEWERAAKGREGRRLPWGEGEPTPERAVLEGRAPLGVDVGACAAGDTPQGLRQMVGAGWEWTATAFGPYPGFEPDPYADYSQPWFGTHRVLRGAGPYTRARLARTTWRNFAEDWRRDLFTGFRWAADA